MIIIKKLRIFGHLLIASGLLFSGLLLTGCASTQSDYIFYEAPGMAPVAATEPAGPGRGESAPVAATPAPETAPVAVASTVPTPAPSAPVNGGSAEVLRVGDPVTVVFSDTPTPTMPFEERVKDDGTITLLYNKTFLATGKSRGDLEREIRAAYVPNIFTRLTVTIKTQVRFYYVGGEVKIPGEKPYLANMTVTKAIQAAGDFTDFAQKKKVRLIRPNGDMFKVNCNDALERPELDLPVYPGDKIHVPRRMW